MSRPPTAWFTIGPFFPPHFVDPGCDDLTTIDGMRARGTPMLLTGRVLEAGGVATVNTILEIWQTDAAGVYAHPNDPRAAEADPGFSGWGRTSTDAQGTYRFLTVMPGAHRDPLTGRMRAPHIGVMVIASGLMRRLVTTVFPAEALPDDPVLDCVADPAARQRLLALRDPSLDRDGIPAYRFDIVLRGEGETPFFLD